MYIFSGMNNKRRTKKKQQSEEYIQALLEGYLDLLAQIERELESKKKKTERN